MSPLCGFGDWLIGYQGFTPWLLTGAALRLSESLVSRESARIGSSRCSEKTRERALGVASFAVGYPVVNDGAITLRGEGS